MKKYILILLVLFFSCSNNENEQELNTLDCECDRVVSVSTFNVIGTLQNPQISYYSVYTTINDCTQIQREKTFTTTNANFSPKLNECR